MKNMKLGKTEILMSFMFLLSQKNEITQWENLRIRQHHRK
jgi:hypothetical protein